MKMRDKEYQGFLHLLQYDRVGGILDIMYGRSHMTIGDQSNFGRRFWLTSSAAMASAASLRMRCTSLSTSAETSATSFALRTARRSFR